MSPSSNSVRAAALRIALAAAKQAVRPSSQRRRRPRTNAHQIVAFLSKANPDRWRLGATTSTMNDHLRLTTNEAVAHLERHWKADIAAYDRVRAEILMMADT